MFFHPNVISLQLSLISHYSILLQQFYLHYKNSSSSPNYPFFMIYGELIVGLPGSGKTTYIKEKKTFLSDRNIYTVNLDPGCVDDVKDIQFDFDIRNSFTTKQFMKKESFGPNLAVKKILELFCCEYENLRNIFSNEDAYYLIDTPGQVESIIIFEQFISKLERDGIKLVTVFLTEINSFTSYETLSFTYITTLQTMIALNNTQINVITKCDLLDKIPLIENIRQIAELEINQEKIPSFCKLLVYFVCKESLVYYELLEYDKNVLGTLQYSIDQGSGYIFEIENENQLKSYFENVLDHDEIFDRYEKNENKALI